MSPHFHHYQHLPQHHRSILHLLFHFLPLPPPIPGGNQTSRLRMLVQPGVRRWHPRSWGMSYHPVIWSVKVFSYKARPFALSPWPLLSTPRPPHKSSKSSGVSVPAVMQSCTWFEKSCLVQYPQQMAISQSRVWNWTISSPLVHPSSMAATLRLNVYLKRILTRRTWLPKRPRYNSIYLCLQHDPHPVVAGHH